MPNRKEPLARVYRPTPRNIAMLARRLAAGELVAVPTETVYGLAANALDADACAEIFHAKGRPLHDPLIVHLHSWHDLPGVCEANASALTLAKRFWPGPLTLVLPKRARIPALVTAGQPSVAVRVPSHPVFRRLLARAKLPLAAPSANPFGYVSPTCAEHVLQGIGRNIRHILDGGPSHIGLESTIVDLRDPKRPTILRPGAITRDQIAGVLGCPVLVRKTKPRSKAAGKVGALAPGMLARHYSPRTPVMLHRKLPATRLAGHAYVFLRRPSLTPMPANVFWLDARGNLQGVARRLFATLRKLDARGLAKIHVELAPEVGIGIAINDRLRRAAAK